MKIQTIAPEVAEGILRRLVSVERLEALQPCYDAVVQAVRTYNEGIAQGNAYAAVHHVSHVATTLNAQGVTSTPVCPNCVEATLLFSVLVAYYSPRLTAATKGKRQNKKSEPQNKVEEPQQQQQESSGDDTAENNNAQQ